MEEGGARGKAGAGTGVGLRMDDGPNRDMGVGAAAGAAVGAEVGMSG